MWARHPAPSLGNPPGLVGIKKTSFELRDTSRPEGHLEILSAGSRGSIFFLHYLFPNSALLSTTYGAARIFPTTLCCGDIRTQVSQLSCARPLKDGLRIS